MTPQDKQKLDQAARLQQMQINTRLTALQASQTLMGTPGFIVKTTAPDGSAPNPANGVDIVTLLAQAQMIEQYILGDIEQETQTLLDEINKPKVQILRPGR